MYLDNIMNRNWQKILYGFMVTIGILLTVSGSLFWIADNKSNEVGFSLGNAGLIGQIQTITAGLSIPVIIGVFWTFYSNKLSIKKQSNNLQLTAISLIVISVASASFLAYQKYDLYDSWYTFFKQTKPDQIVNNSWNETQWSIMLYRHVAMIINISGAALSIVPIVIYIRRSNSFWR